MNKFIFFFTFVFGTILSLYYALLHKNIKDILFAIFRIYMSISGILTGLLIFVAPCIFIMYPPLLQKINFQSCFESYGLYISISGVATIAISIFSIIDLFIKQKTDKPVVKSISAK